MTVFILKLIAMAAMLIDHVAFWLVNNNNVMRNIGRVAFIVYAFLIAESYYHLREKPDRLRSHVFKLLILSTLSEPLHDQYILLKWTDWKSQNTILMLLIGFVALILVGWWEDKNASNQVIARTGAVVICFIAAFSAHFLRTGYGFGGVVLIVLFYVYLQRADSLNFIQRLCVLLLIDVIYICVYIWGSAGFSGGEALMESAKSFNRRLIGTLLAVVPLAFYNRKLGYHSKWFNWMYSAFYPLQFAVLIIARHIIRGF